MTINQHGKSLKRHGAMGGCWEVEATKEKMEGALTHQGLIQSQNLERNRREMSDVEAAWARSDWDSFPNNDCLFPRRPSHAIHIRTPVGMTRVAYVIVFKRIECCCCCCIF